MSNGVKSVSDEYTISVRVSDDDGGASSGSLVDSDRFPTENSRYVSTNGVTYSSGSFQAEIVSMDLQGSSVEPNAVSPLAVGAGYHIDSFFDVFTELSVDIGGGLYHIDSFFDVFTELSIDGGGGSYGLFATEIVSMISYE